MRILTSDTIRNETRSFENLVLEPGQTALVVRSSSCYQKSFAEKRDRIISSFGDFPSFNLEGALPLVEIDYPTISRVQGVLYRPGEESGKEGLFYLNVGQFIPQYQQGNRLLLPQSESIFNQIIKAGQKIKMSGEKDILNFTLDKLRKFILVAIKD